MFAKSFSWAENKRKLFSDRKSRGLLLARAALNSGDYKEKKIRLFSKQTYCTVTVVKR